MDPKPDEAGEAVQMPVALEETNSEEDLRSISQLRSARSRCNKVTVLGMLGANLDEVGETV
jgi:hypothetical protein